MTKPMTLAQWAEAGFPDGVKLLITAPTTPPPTLAQNLRKLNRLNLLTDEALLALVGQAPVDPFGLFGALRTNGAWAFNALDFTAVRVLATAKKRPVAVMRIDLLSDDITYVALKDGQLVEHHQVRADEVIAKMREPDTTDQVMLKWLDEHAKQAVEAGMAG